MNRDADVLKIGRALRAAAEALAPFTPGSIAFERKEDGDPVTLADRAVNDVLHELLPEDGDGWLSEETADDGTRLGRRRVWVVDPLDGTREFVEGIPEWCISVGLVEDGKAVAGGICNPATGHTILGSIETGVTVNGETIAIRGSRHLDEALVLASRSEVRRGEWDRFKDAPFEVRASGSVAYKLALVAAGNADATWTLVPKNEWDVAAGTALVLASGGAVRTLAGDVPSFNRPRTLLDGLVASAPSLASEVWGFLEAARSVGPERLAVTAQPTP